MESWTVVSSAAEKDVGLVDKKVEQRVVRMAES